MSSSEHGGRTYLITGVTGIGAATARLAAIAGAQVFVVGLSPEDGEALVGEIRAVGGEAEHFTADLRESESAAEAVSRCAARFGRIDGLFNVAGISGRRYGDGPLHECTDEGWDITLDTNVRTLFLMCRATLNVMLEQEPDAESGLRGTILNMASVLALSPEPTRFATHAYAASKGAILSLTRSLAAYYAPHKIRANAIAPSLVRTPMSRRAQENPEILAFMKTKQPLCEDLIEADDVAEAALFLLGNASRRITGDTLTVDAGWRVSG